MKMQKEKVAAEK